MSHFLIRFALLLFVASGFLGGEEVSEAGSSDADSGKASAGFESRYRESLSGFAGKPMEKPYVSPNKLYVRPQSFIYLN